MLQARTHAPGTSESCGSTQDSRIATGSPCGCAGCEDAGPLETRDSRIGIGAAASVGEARIGSWLGGSRRVVDPRIPSRAIGADARLGTSGGNTRLRAIADAARSRDRQGAPASGMALDPRIGGATGMAQDWRALVLKLLEDLGLVDGYATIATASPFDHGCAPGEASWVSADVFPRPVSGGQVDFVSLAFRLGYRYPIEGGTGHGAACVVYRINVPLFDQFTPPDAVPSAYADHVGVVFFVGATSSLGVAEIVYTDGKPALGGDDEDAASAIASGLALLLPDGSHFGRTPFPMISVTYNNPGFGERLYHSTGNPRYRGTTERNENGDDYCGPMQAAAMDAVVKHALQVVAVFSALEPRVIVTSFSNGATCASGWMARYTDTDVHAFIEMEGPMDGEEQLVCAECYDPLSTYAQGGACPSLGGLTTLDLNEWLSCVSLPSACGGQAKFQPAWELYYRPPPGLAGDVRDRVRWMQAVGLPGTNVHPYPSAAVTVPYDPANLAEVEAFFAERTAEVNLAARRGAYIRINGVTDHVQPEHYRNRHAWRGLKAAQVVRGCEGAAPDVYWADNEGYFADASSTTLETRDAAAPEPYANDVDINGHPDSWGVWPALGPNRWYAQVDIARWAFGRTFSTTCSR